MDVALVAALGRARVRRRHDRGTDRLNTSFTSGPVTWFTVGCKICNRAVDTGRFFNTPVALLLPLDPPPHAAHMSATSAATTTRRIERITERIGGPTQNCLTPSVPSLRGMDE